MNFIDRLVLGSMFFFVLMIMFLTYFDIMWTWEEFISLHVFQVLAWLFILLLCWQLGAWRWDWLVRSVDRLMYPRKEQVVHREQSVNMKKDDVFFPVDTSKESFLKETGGLVRRYEESL